MAQGMETVSTVMEKGGKLQQVKKYRYLGRLKK